MRTSIALHQTRSKLQWDRKKAELQREQHELVPSAGQPLCPDTMKGAAATGDSPAPPSSSSSRAVLRSMSVPLNLPEVADDFMKAVEEALLEEEKEGREGLRDDYGDGEDGFLPFARTPSSKSTASSEDEFFLPFDEDIDATTASHRSHTRTDGAPAPQGEASSRTSALAGGGGGGQDEKLDPRQGREAKVLASLEEFFLGAGSEIGSSPLSTLHFDKATAAVGGTAASLTSPGGANKTAFGLSSRTASPQPARDEANHSLGGVSPSRVYIRRQESLSSVLEEGAASSQTIPSPTSNGRDRIFEKLSTTGRTTSLPLEGNGSFGSSGSSSNCQPLTRRSSLKKVSSYSTFPPKPSHGDGPSDDIGGGGRPASGPQQSLTRNVSFGNMQIREYNVALSDHPSCSYGPPIQLSWDYQERGVVPVAQYEEDRTRRGRRGGHELLLSFYERHFMLVRQAGYTKREIKETMREVERVKRERMVTDLFLPASPLDETMENVVERVKTYFTVFGGGAGGQQSGTSRARPAHPGNERDGAHQQQQQQQQQFV